MNFEDAAREAYASARNDVVILDTLEFRHPDFVDENDQPTALRFVRDHADLVATLEATAPLQAGQAVTFLACGFELDLPSVESAAAPQLSIVVDNIGAQITRHLDAAAYSDTPIMVTYRAYADTDTSAPQNSPVLTLELSSCQAVGGRITATAQLGDVVNKGFPGRDYDALRFPGLVL